MTLFSLSSPNNFGQGSTVLCRIDVVANFMIVEDIRSIRDLKPRMTFLWKTYGHSFSTVLDVPLAFICCKDNNLYGIL